VSKILIIGLGLIGGSLARSVKATGFATEVRGYGYRDVSLRKGVELGVIDNYSLDLDEAMTDIDIVVLAAPTLVAGEMMKEVLPRLGEHTILTDVASVKGSLLDAAIAANGGKVPPQLVLAHPIAGSEQSGVEASTADLFVDHRVILTPSEETNPEALECIRTMWSSTGADVVELGVVEHDATLAATSHLPHVLAYTLVDALAAKDDRDDIFRFAAGGFRDFTRIASSDPVMWRDIALANRTELLIAIDSFSEHLSTLRNAVESGDGKQMHDIFTRAKAARDAFMVGEDKV
jgi:cyclohexadieny/prephenate dehydrogenase